MANHNIFENAFDELNACQLSILRVMQSGKKFIGTMMPRQVGKTHFGVWCIREFMRQSSNCQTMFLAKDFPSIKRNTAEKFIKLFPEDEFNVTTQGVSHPNPSQHNQRGSCFLSGVDKNPHKIRGGTMAFVHWSEVAFSKFEGGQSFQTIHETVVLPTISRTLGYYYLESTPYGSNFWMTWWQDQNNGFQKILFPLELCVALNAITGDQVDFMRNSMHPDVFKQEMECAFVSFTGKIYTEYKPDRHDMPIEIEPHEKVIIGIDVGFTAAFCAIFAVWRDGVLHVFDQIWQKGLRITQMAQMVEERMQHHKIARENYIAYTDHDTEMVEELKMKKIKVALADKIDPFACRMSIKEGFYFNKIKINPHRCDKLKNELDAAAWHEVKQDTMDERGDPNEGHWDSEAALRYLYRGSKVEQIKVPEEPDEIKADVSSHAEWKARASRRERKNLKEKTAETLGVDKAVIAEVFEY